MRARAACVGVLALSWVGCGGLLGGEGIFKTTLDMNKWAIVDMDVSLEDDLHTICPGQPVTLSIVAEVQHKERDKTKVVHTGKRGRLGFETFAMTGEHGTFDEAGVFHPDPDPLRSIDGFMMKVEHTPNPKFSWEHGYKPSYGCFTQAGGSGGYGMSGAQGTAGSSGSEGGKGGSGGGGVDGGPGQPGPAIVAFATVVRTPHHEALVLMRVEGDRPATVMFDPSAGFVLEARGGSGGAGGDGGAGGAGGRGKSGETAGDGGAGGEGGPGGNGGPGGGGGSIVLTYDARFPELARAITLDASGGAGGRGGIGGSGGAGGHGGSASGEGNQDGSDGAQGPAGPEGRNGPAGASGAAEAVAADVSARFADLPAGVDPL